MSNSTTVKLNITTNDSANTSQHFIQLDFSSSVRLTRDLVQIILLILFIFILTFVGYKQNYSRILSRPFSQLSRFIVSIAIIGLVLNDFLVINGVTHRTWCSIHQLVLHILLIMIISSRLLPDFYEHIARYYHQYDSNTIKTSVIINFIILICIQLVISIKWLWNTHHMSYNEWTRPILCSSSIRSQLFIFLLHLIDFISTCQSLRSPIVIDETNVISSINIFINKKICQLNSTLIRLFYFTTTSILHVLFIPGEFSATFYSSILVIEFIMKYLIIIYHSNIRYERNIVSINNTDRMLHTAYLRLKTDDLSDDTRLLNDID